MIGLPGRLGAIVLMSSRFHIGAAVAYFPPKPEQPQLRVCHDIVKAMVQWLLALFLSQPQRCLPFLFAEFNDGLGLQASVLVGSCEPSEQGFCADASVGVPMAAAADHARL